MRTAVVWMVVGSVISITTIFGVKNIPLVPAHADTLRKNYLALGDSYTIGQSVPASDNFPHLLAIELQHAGIMINEPEIRAVTGWTTGNLLRSLQEHPPALKKYDLVTLLIGVNNQFRGGSPEEYAGDFRLLLDEAIKYTGDKRKVLVVSIPDYSVTPFAAGGETPVIAKAINAFNTIQKKIAAAYGVQFINITGISRKGKHDGTLQAADGLHPSKQQYAKWVKLLLPPARKIMQ